LHRRELAVCARSGSRPRAPQDEICKTCTQISAVHEDGVKESYYEHMLEGLRKAGWQSDSG
jgi:hypothetical protein